MRERKISLPHKEYVFHIIKDEKSVFIRERNKPHRKVVPRLDLVKHDGFDWGKDNIGARQLAVSLLADALDNDDVALNLCEEFSNAVIAKMPHKPRKIKAEAIRSWAHWRNND